jgi:hypothetical protein
MATFVAASLYAFMAGIALYGYILGNNPSSILGPMGLTPREISRYNWDILQSFSGNVQIAIYGALIVVPAVCCVNYGYNVVMKKIALKNAALVNPITTPPTPATLPTCPLSDSYEARSSFPTLDQILPSVVEQLVSCSSVQLSMDVLIFLSQFTC